MAGWACGVKMLQVRIVLERLRKRQLDDDLQAASGAIAKVLEESYGERVAAAMDSGKAVLAACRK